MIVCWKHPRLLPMNMDPWNQRRIILTPIHGPTDTQPRNWSVALSSIQHETLNPWTHIYICILVLIHMNWPWIDYSEILEIDYGVKSTKYSNIHVAYYLRASRWYEQEIDLYAIYSSLSVYLELWTMHMF